MYGQAAGRRPVGVKIPVDQNTEQSNKPDLTIENIAPIEFLAAQYVEKGKIKVGLFCLSGGVFYLAPEGDTWLQKMRPLSEKLTNNVRDAYDRMYGASPAEVPSEDVVDIIAQTMAADHSQPATEIEAGVDVMSQVK